MVMLILLKHNATYLLIIQEIIWVYASKRFALIAYEQNNIVRAIWLMKKSQYDVSSVLPIMCLSQALKNCYYRSKIFSGIHNIFRIYTFFN